MKKIYLFLGLALMSMLTVSCEKTPETPDGPDPEKGDVVVQITATIADEGVVWEEGAQISVNGVKSSVLAEGGENVAAFDVVNVAAPLVVVTPVSAYDGGDEVTLPDTQKYVAGGYDSEAWIMYGYTEEVISEDEEGNTLEKSLANVEVACACGVISVPVTVADGSAVSVSAISLAALAENQSLAGVYSFDFASGKASVERGYSSIDLTIDEPVVVGAEAPATFNFVVPAGKYAGGLSVTLTDTEGHNCIAEYEADVTVAPAATTELEAATFVIHEKGDVTINASINEAGVVWAAGDQLVVNGILSEPVADAAVGAADASVLVKNIVLPYNVFYPATLYTDTGRLRMYDTQTLVKNGFDREALVMVGYSTTEDVTLHNLCGLLKIPVTNKKADDVVTIKQVDVVANDNSALAGRFTVNYRNATLKLVSASSALTLTPEGNGIEIAPDESIDLYVVVPEGTIPAGINVTLYTDFGTESVNCAPSSGVKVTRGAETELTTFEFTDIKIEAISTADEFAQMVMAFNRGPRYINNFKNAEGNIVLANDIDLTGVAIESLEGPEKAGFNETLDGKGFTLKGLALDKALTSVNDGTIKNLVFDGCSLAGLVGTNNGTVSDIAIKGSALTTSLIDINTSEVPVSNITIDSYSTLTLTSVSEGINLGMVVGSNAGVVEKCSVDAVWDETIPSLPGASCNFGGVVGASSGLVSECTFNGTFALTVTAPTKSTYHTFGGVVAYAAGAEDDVIVSGCTNNGKVSITFKTAVYFITGGVVGGTPSAKKCPSNYGIIENCVNNGEVSMCYIDGGSGAYPVCGGVCGYVEGYVSGLTNYGPVSLVCKSTSATWTCAKEAGCAGVVTIGAKDCHNYGKITASGLFAGGTAGAKNAANTDFSVWSGVIAAAGPYTPSSSCKFENCTNNVDLELLPGSTTGTPQLTYGGVFGWLTGAADNCVNNNAVKANGSTQCCNIGGISGGCECAISNSKNYGTIEFDDSNYINTKDEAEDHKNRHQVRMGGISGAVGYVAGITTNLTNCENSGTLKLAPGVDGSTVESAIGGIYGKVNKGAVTAEGCTNTGKIDAPAFDCIKKGNIGGLDNDY